MKTQGIALVASLLGVLDAGPLPAADWPAWRGPHGTGVCAERDLPVEWSKTDNVETHAALWCISRKAAVSPPSAAKEPTAIDLRPDFEKWGLAPRVQGARGTCSVFTVVGAMEYALAEKQDRGTRLSVEFLNWASNQAAKNAEDGGFFSDLWKGYSAYGICPEKDMPYREQFDATAQPDDQALQRARELRNVLRLHWIKRWDPKKGLSPEQLAEVKRALGRRRPVCGGFLWPKNEQWTERVLQMCPREQVRDGHSVLLVGYRDDEKQPGGGVFLIRNSGGARRDGLLTYEYVLAYMNDAVWIGPAALAAQETGRASRRAAQRHVSPRIGFGSEIGSCAVGGQ